MNWAVVIYVYVLYCLFDDYVQGLMHSPSRVL